MFEPAATGTHSIAKAANNLGTLAVSFPRHEDSCGWRGDVSPPSERPRRKNRPRTPDRSRWHSTAMIFDTFFQAAASVTSALLHLDESGRGHCCVRSALRVRFCGANRDGDGTERTPDAQRFLDLGALINDHFDQRRSAARLSPPAETAHRRQTRARRISCLLPRIAPCERNRPRLEPPCSAEILNRVAHTRRRRSRVVVGAGGVGTRPARCAGRTKIAEGGRRCLSSAPVQPGDATSNVRRHARLPQ